MHNSFSQYIEVLWDEFFNARTDTIPEFGYQILKTVRATYDEYKWHRIYDFLEFSISEIPPEYRNFIIAQIAPVLEREMSAFRLVNGQFVPITNERELAAINEAVNSTNSGMFAGVNAHLTSATLKIADRIKPDFRNSIKESISAVEAATRIITGDSNATLSDAVKKLRKNGKVHPSLERAFLKLYGYTSDEGGIRHAMLEDPDIDFEDAKYMLISCSAFITYLIAKTQTK